MRTLKTALLVLACLAFFAGQLSIMFAKGSPWWVGYVFALANVYLGNEALNSIALIWSPRSPVRPGVSHRE